MNNREKYIEELAERFFAGGTSCAEEKTLYDYFAGGEIAPELMRFKTVFGYFGNMTEEDPPGDITFREAKRITWYRVAGPAIAASLLLGVTWLGVRDITPEYDPFAGSYMIVDGVKITDPEIVYPVARELLHLTQEINNEIDEAISLSEFVITDINPLFQNQ